MIKLKVKIHSLFLIIRLNISNKFKILRPMKIIVSWILLIRHLTSLIINYKIWTITTIYINKNPNNKVRMNQMILNQKYLNLIIYQHKKINLIKYHKYMCWIRKTLIITIKHRTILKINATMILKVFLISQIKI